MDIGGESKDFKTSLILACVSRADFGHDTSQCILKTKKFLSMNSQSMKNLLSLACNFKLTSN